MTARFIVLFETPAGPEAFDRHYHDVHIPLARRLPGLRRYTIGRDLVAVRGGFPYYRVAELEWDSMDELHAAFASPEGRAAAADTAHLQKLAPVRSMIFTVDESVL
ncbi:EthD family reductase [Streptomyces sp. DG2A-72]|uniref:EthD family reductase n=1 Tax=Streptomyces sp. DG2A-72 TaxID=3051386 RepID=UPI00265BE639|nr:EthD family reductase [Streptomyces sp. DG2A-72]MDO0930459.1 EthD family reductase [Streptomyces sp. DG2A-72]